MVVCCMRLRHASPLPHLLTDGDGETPERRISGYVGTYHLCENKDEIAWVKELYPEHDAIWMFITSMA